MPYNLVHHITTHKWIKRAVKHKGSLERWAKEKGLLNENGTIDLRRAEEYAKKHELTHRVRQVNLARTLRKIHKK